MAIGMDSATEQLGAQLLEAAKIVEGKLDAEIERLDKMDDDELDKIRQRRVEEMKKIQNQKNLWQIAGHGEFSEITNEKEFFAVEKKSERVVCLFYDNSTLRSKLVEKILKEVAEKHLETKFVKVNWEKVPFLVKKLNIRVVPTLAFIKSGKVFDYLRANGPEEPNFSWFENELSTSGIIFVGLKNVEPQKVQKVKIIRDSGNRNDSDDDDDW